MMKKNKCLTKQDLILFYYQELERSELNDWETHLKECPRCASEYEKIKGLLTQIPREEITLTDQEIDIMLKGTKERLRTYGIWARIKDSAAEFFNNVRLGLSYRPQLIPILAAVLIAVSLVIPWANRNYLLRNRNIDILEIEIELSLDIEGDSIFDFYEDELFPPENKVEDDLLGSLKMNQLDKV